MVLEFKILFHDKVAIQQLTQMNSWNKGVLLLSYHLHLSYGYSTGFAENRNLKYLNLNLDFKFKFKS
jgi:hypothetical protein